MSAAPNLLDRLRIERVVWSLDQRLYDIPRRSRIAHRREVRANLLTAAGDIGTTEALRNIGTSRQLAADFRDAEYGSAPQPMWIDAALFFLTAQLILTALLTEAANAFGEGVTATDPGANGSYRWQGIRYLQHAVTYRFVDGQGNYDGGSWTPLAWAIWIAVTVAIAKPWRAPVLRRRAT